MVHHVPNINEVDFQQGTKGYKLPTVMSLMPLLLNTIVICTQRLFPSDHTWFHAHTIENTSHSDTTGKMP